MFKCRGERFLSVEKKKVEGIVRYKRVLLLANGFDEMPIFRATEA
jgi:hypothetical protein